MRISDWSSDVCSSDLRVAATGDMLVGNGEVHPVSVTAGADGRLAFATDSGAPFTTATGSLAGLSEAANHVADQRADLDALAGQFAGQINAAHQAGFDAAGNAGAALFTGTTARSEAHTSEIQSLMRISYA